MQKSESVLGNFHGMFDKVGVIAYVMYTSHSKEETVWACDATDVCYKLDNQYLDDTSEMGN